MQSSTFLKTLTFVLFTFSVITVSAQDRKISGTLTDRDTKETLIGTTVQLLKHDSTFVTGGVTNEQGVFSIKAPQNGKYILRITSVGYLTATQNVEVTKDQDVNIGNIVMNADAVMLKEAVATAQALKVVLKEDTFVYNAAAYRTPEGSVVEELVKRLPGAKIDDDGKITINGKEVKKIMVDGKEFMNGDTKTALKNLPTSIIEKVKSYDEKSDLAKITGIDDGDEQTVLDFGLKRGMNHGFFSNIDLGVGTKDRYAERLMGAYFNDKWRVMGFGNANNVNDRGFGGRGGGFSRGRDGLQTFKMAGMNFNYEEKNKLKIDGSVRWNHNNSDAWSKNSSEDFISKKGAFSNRINQNYSRNDSWNFNARLEWMPDTMTNITFRPRMSLSKSDGLSNSVSANYSVDPYLFVTDPLTKESYDILHEDSNMVNSSKRNSISYGDNKSYGGMLQYNRKLSSNGRNVTLRADASYSDNASTSLSTNDVLLWLTDSAYQTNRYNLTPAKSYNYSAQFTYSEPLWKATFLQFSYKFNYSYNKSDRSTYDFSNLGAGYFDALTAHYRGWNPYLGMLADGQLAYDSDRSRFSEYKNYQHEIQLQFRMIREKYNFNAGFLFQPISSRYNQRYLGIDTVTTRSVFNWSPTVDFRYRFSKVSNLRVNYRGTTSQPSMSQLLDIRDDNDPLNISHGNPRLKPSFTNNLRVFYNNYIENHMQFLATNFHFSTTRNSISNMVSYNEETGGRETYPENINGNWSTSGSITYNMAIDTTGIWNINTSTDYSYSNHVGYLFQDNMTKKNTTKSQNIQERLGASFRNNWNDWDLEIELNGSFNYQHTRNALQATANLDTWQFAYGTNINFKTPWGMAIATDLHESSRRGYNDASMNTNEFVWNLQMSQSFLKGKPLTVSLQFYDILDNQSNFSRTISAMQRSDTEYNAVNSYAMLHVIYRLNLFGGKNMNRQMQPGGPGGDAPRGNRGNRGGWGGNRGPRGGFGGFM